MTNSCLQLVLRPLNKSLELVQSSLQNWVDDVAQSIIPSYSTHSGVLVLPAVRLL